MRTMEQSDGLELYSESGNEQNIARDQYIDDTEYNTHAVPLMPSPEEHHEIVKSKTETIKPFCYVCNITNTLLFTVITEENKEAHICLRCLNKKLIDDATEHFINDSTEYEGRFYNYKDNIK